MCPPLMAVVLRGDMSKLKVLLRQKVDMTLKDAEGYTAIFYAIYGEATHPVSGDAQMKSLTYSAKSYTMSMLINS